MGVSTMPPIAPTEIPQTALAVLTQLADDYGLRLVHGRQQSRLEQNGRLVGGFNRRHNGVSDRTGWHFYVTAKTAPRAQWEGRATGFGFKIDEHPEGHFFWWAMPSNTSGFRQFITALLDEASK